MYSSDFTAQHQTLFLHLIGAYLKIIITPLALLILAKGRGFVFVVTELVFWLTYFIALFLLYSEFNLLATGISYVVAYILYIPMIVGVTYHYDKAYLSKNLGSLFFNNRDNRDIYLFVFHLKYLPNDRNYFVDSCNYDLFIK